MGRPPISALWPLPGVSAGRMCHIPLGEPKTQNIISQVGSFEWRSDGAGDLWGIAQEYPRGRRPSHAVVAGCGAAVEGG